MLEFIVKLFSLCKFKEMQVQFNFSTRMIIFGKSCALGLANDRLVACHRLFGLPRCTM